jgi:hypothetical protein
VAEGSRMMALGEHTSNGWLLVLLKVIVHESQDK